MNVHESPPIFEFDNSYSCLPERFYARLDPVPVKAPRLIMLNQNLAAELRMQADMPGTALADIFAGNRVPAGAAPMAMAYAGHQFGHFVPQLGDGRAILLGEVIDRHGAKRDIQLKGSGRTPYSRNGDGRAALGPVIREYIVSEAMHALGIPTTRSLALATTGEPVFRETPMAGAILTRVAKSHVRIGTLEYFAARGDAQGVRLLADYVIARLCPESLSRANPYTALLEHALRAQAELIARWMNVGFIHGVMNTDNTALSGETLDYGPCAFMDHFDPMMVFSSIDVHGRYAYGNQPAIAQWNLARLAETLLPLIHPDADKAVEIAGEVISAFPSIFKEFWLDGMRKKLGLFTREEGDVLLIESLLSHMHLANADFTVTFRRLCHLAQAMGDMSDHGIPADWTQEWRERLQREHLTAGERNEAMRKVNPAYIPRNHRIQEAINAAVGLEDFSVMRRLTQALENPFEENDAFAGYAIPPLPDERIRQTFCGT